MKNTTIIKRHFKSSTIPRMKSIYGFKTLKSIDECIEVQRALEAGLSQNERCIQEVLFDLIDSEIKMSAVRQYAEYELDGDLPF